MLQKVLQVGEDVHVEVLAVEDRFAAAVFTPGHVELVLAVVVHLVVRVEGTDKHLYLAHYSSSAFGGKN